MDQLANALINVKRERERESEFCPSNPEVNPKNEEHEKAITLRNGRPIKISYRFGLRKSPPTVERNRKSQDNSLPTTISSIENSAIMTINFFF
ncbi:hypothetical protein GBA52_028906 [Prunus armeniaca]|nr:hypothetical protein GBA52_028906 [Prunus armeniaca]